MRHTVENNLKLWDADHPWPRDGDEWDGQARRCRQPYEAWKQSLVEHLIFPHLSDSSTVLEIGPGHGRWSKEIVGRCRQLVLVDLSPSCIDHCRSALAEHSHVFYRVTDGRSLPDVDNESVDFVWSYDAFVHMSPEVIESYLGEIRRVLKPDGRAVIHHPGRRHASLPLRFLRDWGGFGTWAYKVLSMGQVGDEDGWRSDVSRRLFRRLAERQGLAVEAQIRRWGERREHGVPRFRDAISQIRREDQRTAATRGALESPPSGTAGGGSRDE